ncbi:MAG TPA: 23S rRNA (adenine(2503)-C(2))-methyltransferase RlmN [Pirellulaceae bacterium]|nr:23S rRNA (adenine(2503)-C(2))-methyltransferase RlmN [Pirellulaceae bacterium]
MPSSLLDLPRSSLARLLADWGFSAAHGDRLWRYLYREAKADFAAMEELPRRLRERLLASANIDAPSVLRETVADGGLTTKHLLELADGQRIETVLMRPSGRVTACLSSQAGCPLGCVFCATGQMGFGRNLSAGEIVAQAVHVQRRLGPATRLRNVVLMGMGEPLLNYESVLRAADILGDGGGLAIAGKRLTLSTVGVVPGIVRLADEGRTCSLAVSLHAATQEERAALVPAAATWPLADLMRACRYYAAKLGRRIFFEWTLIAGRSDSPEQALELARLVRGLPAHINLIPLNPTAGYAAAPAEPEAVRRFQAALREQGLPCTIRRRRGIAIAAGCGQLVVADAASALAPA